MEGLNLAFRRREVSCDTYNPFTQGSQSQKKGIFAKRENTPGRRLSQTINHEPSTRQARLEGRFGLGILFQAQKICRVARLSWARTSSVGKASVLAQAATVSCLESDTFG